MMCRIVSVAIIAALALAAPAFAGTAGGRLVHGGVPNGTFHGGFRGGVNGQHSFQRVACCFGANSTFLVGGLAAPAYGYPFTPPVYVQPASDPTPIEQTTMAATAAPVPPAPPKVCYVGGCYHLQGGGTSGPSHWVWVPNPPAIPPSLPER